MGKRGITAGKTAGVKGFNPIWIIVVVLAIGLGVFAGLYFSQQGGETIKISPTEERINQKILRGETLTPEEQAWLNKSVEEETRKFLESQGITTPAPTATAAPTSSGKEWPIKGTWKVQTSSGELTIIYRETDSAKGKIKVLVDEETVRVQNLLDRTVDLLVYYREDGSAVQVSSGDLRPRGENSMGAHLSKAKTYEFWFEVK